jgi:dipeptidyl aminopeptidase/acylaminoacyl peptidase
MNRQKQTWIVLLTILLLAPISAAAQALDRDKLVAQLETQRCVDVEDRKLKFCKFNYEADGRNVEAIAIFPLEKGNYPGVLLLPGFEGTAKTLLGVGMLLAQQGFACLAVTPPGFGKSEGKRDFMGPASIDAFATGFRKFRHDPYVDSTKMGIFGYSRGGMAASLLAVKLGHEVKAAVLGAGVYDFKRAYEDTKLDGIRENMQIETGMTETAIKERSSILQMKKLHCPVLIIHGENDSNAPTSQAYLLRDRLVELKKDFEFMILQDHVHGQLKGNFLMPVIDFLSRKLKGTPASLKLGSIRVLDRR